MLFFFSIRCYAANDIEQLKGFPCGGYCDDSTIVYLKHPVTILSALEVLGYTVIASSSTAVKQDYNEYMWTMRKNFLEPEPGIVDAAKRKIVNYKYADKFFPPSVVFFF